MEKLFPHIPILGVLVWLLAAASPAWGENPQSPAERRAEQLAEFQLRIRELDSPCYETRQLAAERLEDWVDRPEMATLLAEQFQQLVLQPELPLEVRWRILIWRKRLPPVKSEPPRSAPAEELERLVRQLDDDSYSVRAGAFERLQWMAASAVPGQADPAAPEASFGRSPAHRGFLSPPGIGPQHRLGALACRRCAGLGPAAGFRCADRRLAG